MQNRGPYSVFRQGELSARRAQNGRHAQEEERVTYSFSRVRLTLRTLLAFTLCFSLLAGKYQLRMTPAFQAKE